MELQEKFSFIFSDFTRELTEDLLAAPSACAEVNETAQAYPDATGTEKEAATWERN